MMDANIPRRALPSEGDPFSKVAAWARHAVYVRAARTFIEACEADGIAVLPVKGIISAHTLYDDPADRPLTDVDVRVVPSDARRVEKLCRRRGWQIIQRMHTYSNVVTVVDGVCVDVEAHVGPPGLCKLRVAQMLERARWTTSLGFRCRQPDYSDHAVSLIVNAFKDKLFGAFEWAIRDLEQIPRRGDFNRAVLVERVRESDLTTIAHITADWMVRYRSAHEWSFVRDALGALPRPLFARVLEASLRKNRNGLFARLLARNAADSRSRRALALMHMALWQGEVVLSQIGSTPYTRGNMIAEVRAKVERH